MFGGMQSNTIAPMGFGFESMIMAKSMKNTSRELIKSLVKSESQKMVLMNRSLIGKGTSTRGKIMRIGQIMPAK